MNALAQVIPIGSRKRRAKGENPLAVGLDDRGIDTIDRGPAHQSKRRQRGV